MKRQVIFDCDPGHDDAIALLLALSNENLDVKLITTSAGNQTQEKVLLNTKKLLSFIGVIDIEVARGAEKPLIRELIIADNIHGETGLDGSDLGTPLFEESKRSALEAMRELLSVTEDKLTIIATGPLTNIAILLLAYPELKEKIDCISLMGGAALGGNWTPAAEFNIYVDPEAANIVFESGVPIIMSGLDVTTQARLYKEDIERIRNIGNKTSNIIAPLLDFFSENSPPYYMSKDGYFKGAHMHDPCAVAYLIDPTIFNGITCNVSVETSGKLTTGTTVVDVNQRTGKVKNTEVLFEIDRERFVNMLVSAIGYYK
ncbi:pyrimidine-specific ribonucleoside hydrolase [Evansella vedderi]|uniref:Pyrimidine-specific ribonucleoside hydrolase n=1 Tax=Evansella vedderi TaxID=38282 RepID=A0ABT9ZNX6_9BACI|nr:nucleoside hydrolase [Evansella vedderi]MDQ0252948.1 pyrimidine-specific ribonucleoside hydrolase [Evansella vedderi]